MKRIVVALFMVLAFCVPGFSSQATDVWVSHWNYENVDLYVMDNTISCGRTSDGRWLKASVKMVRNGELQQIVKWDYSQFGHDFWRYETNTMDGTHTCIVTARDYLFEYCMNQVGWSYRLVDKFYYK